MDDDLEPLLTYQVNNLRRTEPLGHPCWVDNDTIIETIPSNVPEVANFDTQGSNDGGEQSKGKTSHEEDHSLP